MTTRFDYASSPKCIIYVLSVGTEETILGCQHVTLDVWEKQTML